MLEGFVTLLKERRYLIDYITKMLILPFCRKLVTLLTKSLSTALT